MLWSKFLKRIPDFMLLKKKSIIKYYFLVEKIISTIHGNHQASRIDVMRGKWESSRRKGSNLFKENC